MLYSFDVFDTCLVRKCGESNNVFDIMAERAFCTSVTSEEKRAFVAARLEAAANSWSEKQTLCDIYDAFHYVNPNLKPKHELIELEQSVEREMLCPVQEMVGFVDSVRRMGNRIVFISDMYLGSVFLKSILQEADLYRQGDSIYVSCDVGATKASGKLFSYVHQHENIPYREWHHYGDNAISDFKVPRKLGIHAHLISHKNTPYQLAMKQQPSLFFQWGSVLAGISRSIALHDERSSHKDFVLDIIAPLFISFTYRVLSDAYQRGIQSLYFCARDAYPLYKIAKKLRSLFPNVSVHYLYISRKSLYEGEDANKIGFFSQIGLASRSANNAIVDVRSSGKTLQILNKLVTQNGYNPIFGYFFELCSANNEQRQGLKCYVELDDLYLQQASTALRKLPSNWYMYELFFPLNTQKRTIGYEWNGFEYEPILETEDNEEFRLKNLSGFVEWRNWAIDTYTDCFIQLGLNKYADEVFAQYAIPQLAVFFLVPNKHYLGALSCFYGLDKKKGYLPYVDKSVFRLPKNIFLHGTIWKRGTIFFSLPIWLSKLLYRIK